MSVRDFPPRPQGASPDSVPYQNWLDALGQRQNIDLLQELTSVATGDELAIFDVDETGQNKTKKVTVANLGAAIGGGIDGPVSSTDNAVARWDGTGGDTLKDSAFIVDNSGHVTSFGGQIKFPATQSASSDANTLDDYEEGTFTPGVSFGGGTTGIAYSAQVGVYTKIGDRVFISARIALTSKGSSTGTALVTGLPFTSRNVTNLIGALAINGGQFAAAVNFPNTVIIPNVTTLTLANFAAGAGTTLTDTGLTNTTVINIGGDYAV